MNADTPATSAAYLRQTVYPMTMGVFISMSPQLIWSRLTQ